MTTASLVLAVLLLAPRGASGQKRGFKQTDGKTPEMRAAFEEMHELYCKGHDHMDSPLCSVYYGRRSGGSERPPLPPRPPSKEEIFEMHRLFCEDTPDHADTYPCQKWVAKKAMQREKLAQQHADNHA